MSLSLKIKGRDGIGRWGCFRNVGRRGVRGVASLLKREMVEEGVGLVSEYKGWFMYQWGLMMTAHKNQIQHTGCLQNIAQFEG